MTDDAARYGADACAVAVVHRLATVEEPQTAAALADAIPHSVSRVRNVLAGLHRAGRVEREPAVPGGHAGTPLQYRLGEWGEDDAADQPFEGVPVR
jgi:hypothetical protein